MSLRIVSLSDTHTRHSFKIPEGDILIHSGDLTFRGSVEEIAKEIQWLKEVKVGHGFSHVISIPGNHDWLAEKDPALMKLLFRESSMNYLHHESIELEGIKFFGSGYTPEFCGWALGYSRYSGESIKLWSKIPDDTQILITHGPPKGIGDLTLGFDDSPPQHVGCFDLLDRINNLKSLTHHIFGHIHSGYGITKIGNVTYANSSICNEKYQAVNTPHVFDWLLK